MTKKIFISLFVLGLFIPTVSFAGHNNAHSIQQLEAQITALETQIQDLRSRITELRQSDQQQDDQQVISGSSGYFTFSHNDGTLVVGVDRWTFKLWNARQGDRLTIKAWKNGVAINGGRELQICRVSSGRTCETIGAPTRRDVGFWEETVLINGVEKGRISFHIEARPEALESNFRNISFTFSHRNRRLVAGRDSWNLNITGLQIGDEVYVEAWKNGVNIGKFKVCKAQAISSPIQRSSCGATGTPKEEDIGRWEESIIVRRDSTDTVVKERGTIRFEVINANGGAMRFDLENGFSSVFKATNQRLLGISEVFQ